MRFIIYTELVVHENTFTLTLERNQYPLQFYDQIISQTLEKILAKEKDNHEAASTVQEDVREEK